MMEKMKGLNFQKEVIDSIFSLISGLLHLGEISISGDDYKSQVN